MIKIISDKTKNGVKVGYPKLMEITHPDNKRTVVLFHSDKAGVVIKGVDYWSGKEGEYYTKWEMGHFTDYNEPITIQNA